MHKLFGLDEEVWLQIKPFSFPLNKKEHPNLLSQPPSKLKEIERKMPTAYVLLNTEIGAENEILKALRKIEGVEEAHNLCGVYDIIANVKADSLEKLKSIIIKRIEKVGRINSKLTMIITDKPQSTIQEQVIFEKPPLIL